MPDPTHPAPARPATSVNADIRALWLRAGGHLSPELRSEYERLVVEWAAAVRAEGAVAEAA